MLLEDSVESFRVNERPCADQHECKAVLVPDEDGGYYIYASRLPGVVSQGEDREEAIVNIWEAFQGALETYRELGQPVPWKDVTNEPKGEQLWILRDE